VLTAEPIYPLEGGARVYPELAVGRFEPRAAKYLSSPQDRARYLIPNFEEMNAWFMNDPPAAVFITRRSEKVGDAFSAMAASHGYEIVEWNERKLWIRR